MRAEFDEFAGNYDAALNQGLKFTGESRSFFAAGRMRWLSRRLGQMGFRPHNALDFGSGTGGSLPFFFECLGVKDVIATDVSAESLTRARNEHPDLNVEYQLLTQFKARGNLDLVFCNGVFHHIPSPDRLKVVTLIYEALRPGGLVAFWENNPWNPVTRFMMNRVSFDQDAILVWPRTGRGLLRQAGFEIVGTDFMFIFPSVLAPLRVMERWLVQFPLGGQYLVLGQKPKSAAA